MIANKCDHAYILGVALGDGNLSNPNGRAIRLRITCDKKYPNLIEHINNKLKCVLPKNKTSFIDRKNALDICCYSNKLSDILGWSVGSKKSQNAHIPEWIMKSEKYSRECLRGLLQTDGSIYLDRGYPMVNFTTIIKPLAEDVKNIILFLGYKPQVRYVKHSNKSKYIIRISKNVTEFINEIDLWKN